VSKTFIAAGSLGPATVTFGLSFDSQPATARTANMIGKYFDILSMELRFIASTTAKRKSAVASALLQI
jgi:hypothetical protein